MFLIIQLFEHYLLLIQIQGIHLLIRLLQDQVTVERVRGAYGALVKGKIDRYELPNIGALNFVLHDALAGGVTTSLSSDPHGKSFSAIMVAIDLPEPEVVYGRKINNE